MYYWQFKSKNNKLYVDYSGDLYKRVKEHNLGLVKSTKSGMPWNLIYYEACLDRNDAEAREKYLKAGPGKKYLKNRLKRFLLFTGFGQ